MRKIFDYFEDRVEFPKNILDHILPTNVLWEYMDATFLNGLINHCKPLAVYQLDRYTPDSETLKTEFELITNSLNVKFSKTKSILRDLVINEEIEFDHTNLSVFKDDIIILGEIESNEDTENIYTVDLEKLFPVDSPNKNNRIFDKTGVKEALKKYIQTTDTLEILSPAAKKKFQKKKYIFFWFDYDVSDCCVGIFETIDSTEIIKQSIENFLQNEEWGKSKNAADFGFDNGVVSHTELPLSFLHGWLKF
jgi:hypothetical protein